MMNVSSHTIVDEELKLRTNCALVQFEKLLGEAARPSRLQTAFPKGF